MTTKLKPYFNELYSWDYESRHRFMIEVRGLLGQVAIGIGIGQVVGDDDKELKKWKMTDEHIAGIESIFERFRRK